MTVTEIVSVVTSAVAVASALAVIYRERMKPHVDQATAITQVTGASVDIVGAYREEVKGLREEVKGLRRELAAAAARQDVAARYVAVLTSTVAAAGVPIPTPPADL